MNQFQFTGRVYKDIDTHYTPDGKMVANFKVSISNGKKLDGGWKPSLWVKVNAWERLAERLNTELGDGDQVFVSGKLDNREYEHEGVKRQSLECTARDVFKLVKGAPATSSEPDESELPFRG